MVHSLLPKKIIETDPSYESVRDLSEALDEAIKNKRICNIALTGPFGSGKSSVLQTLKDNLTTNKPEKFNKKTFYYLLFTDSIKSAIKYIYFSSVNYVIQAWKRIYTTNKFEFLNISLATLQTDDEKNSDKRLKIENLNRKIEYSILQQIIYKEKAGTVPNSRFRRIVHLTKNQIKTHTYWCIGFIIAFLIAFEPTFINIDTISDYFNFGKSNLYFDMASVAYMLYALSFVFKYFFKTYCNSKLNKLNLKDGEIEVIENNSIFNQHLDEILYFFQVTEYNVVIIEDLDRFETSNIFLKLRELNLLINESNIVDHHVVFLYAIKDDQFINEDRTKFFDYISTVIPVINPSNSKDKLKTALEERGCAEDKIKDEDLSEIAFFIQDMRILTNIANEYVQYKNKLISDIKNQKLNLTKLLAMIVYKNYHPEDFAQLHRREGKVYTCISLKKKFIEFALSEITKKEEQFNAKNKEIIDNYHLKENELRLLFLYELKSKIADEMKSIRINGEYKNFKAIANNTDIFNMLLEQTTINYECPYYSSSRPSDSNYNVANFFESSGYKSRLNSLKLGDDYNKKEKKEIDKEKLKLKSLRLCNLITQYKLGKESIYSEIGLSPMMDIFIRQGYLDEEYYDYISYFYEGMLSLSDRDLLLSIKQQISKGYDYHIDKIENFVKELRLYHFADDSILNIQLLDFLTKNNNKESEKFNLIMKLIERNDPPLKFLCQYYINGDQQKKVFNHFIEFNKQTSWQSFLANDDPTQKDALIEAWLKYSGAKEQEQKSWINGNYSFLSERYSKIGDKRCEYLIGESIFKTLNNNCNELLAEVITKSYYEINEHNLCLIINFLSKSQDTTPEKLTLTLIEGTKKECFFNYVKANIVQALPKFSKQAKNESVENILFILNHEEITGENKKSYLENQIKKIPTYDNIISADMQTLATKIFLITPTWDNISCYYDNSGKDVTDDLISFIEHNSSSLSSDKFNGSNGDPLFKSLFGSNKLTTDTYKELCNCFNFEFNGDASIQSIEKERLSILLEFEKLPFSDENIEALQSTPIYTDFLLHHSQQFIEKLDEKYSLDQKTAETLLQSNKFSNNAKLNIISIIEDVVLKNSQKIADITIDLLLKENITHISKDKVLELLPIAKDTPNKVRIITNYLPSNIGEDSEVEDLLKRLNIPQYYEISDKSRKPTFDNTCFNHELLTNLENIGYISSFSEDKNGKLRVYHKRN